MPYVSWYIVFMDTVKTTVYFPAKLKSSIEQEAARQGVSEAEIIRKAVENSISRPKPNIGFLIEEDQGISDKVDELLDGFGE